MPSKYVKYRLPLAKFLKYSGITSVMLVIILGFFAFSVTCLDDSVSIKLRTATEHYLNNYVEHLTNRAKRRSLSSFDLAVLHTGALIGIVITRFSYPEASILLYHYIYGDGSDLELSSGYFRKSRFLRKQIEQLGPGDFGPIGIRQNKDWRLSLALNHYSLSITKKKVRIYVPKIEFATLDSVKVPTVIPLGKMRLRMYDNLVIALNPTSFYVYSEWEID